MDWISKRDKKETGKCCACGTYKMNAQFYDWYSHPCISKLLQDKYHGKICIKCAKREAGTKHFKDLNDR